MSECNKQPIINARSQGQEILQKAKASASVTSLNTIIKRAISCKCKVYTFDGDSSGLRISPVPEYESIPVHDVLCAVQGTCTAVRLFITRNRPYCNHTVSDS